MDLTGIPGSELVRQGIEDLRRGRHTISALLVAIGEPRLRRAGLAIPSHTIEHPEHRLFEALAATNPDAAHSRYNAFLRRLVSFERCVA